VSPAKMVEPIQVLFGVWTKAYPYPRDHVLGESVDPARGRGNLEGRGKGGAMWSSASITAANNITRHEHV